MPVFYTGAEIRNQASILVWEALYLLSHLPASIVWLTGPMIIFKILYDFSTRATVMKNMNTSKVALAKDGPGMHSAESTQR